MKRWHRIFLKPRRCSWAIMSLLNASFGSYPSGMSMEVSIRGVFRRMHSYSRKRGRDAEMYRRYHGVMEGGFV